jgi:protocatechuate 3,4-dioxygenase beta subunit
MRIKVRTLIAAVAAVVAIVYLIHGGGDEARTQPKSPTARRGLAELIANLPTPEQLRLRPIYIDAGDLRLEGQAIDADQRPIAGATITLNGNRTTTSEADGSFAFDSLAAAEYRISAEKDTYFGEDTISLDATSDPLELKLVSGPAMIVHVVTKGGAAIADAKVEGGGRTAITDRDGAAKLRGLELDGTLLEVSAKGYATERSTVATGDDPKATVEHTVTLGTSAPIEGIVVDEDGKPVAKASVDLRNAIRSWSDNVDADEQGHWHADNFGAGKIIASASGEAHVATKDLIIDHDGVHAKTGVVIRVERGATVSGVVLDASGKGVEDASVSCNGGGGRSDASGKFTIKGLQAGDNEISASLGSRGSQLQRFTLAKGGHKDVVIVLVESSIAGIVTGTHGEPLEDIQVYARSETLTGGFGRTDEHGRFDLGGLTPGQYELVAERNSDRQYIQKGVTISTGTRNVRLVLPDVAKLVGRVVLDGKPVDYFGVSIHDDPEGWGSPDVVRSPDGRFEQRDLRPGRWSLTIVGTSFERIDVKNIDVGEGKIVDLGDIAVARGRSVRGRVTDESGVPIANALVAVSDHTWAQDDDGLRGTMAGTRTTHTDALGHYEIPGITAGTQTLHLQASDAHGVALPRELAPSDEVVDLVIVRTGSIDGVVVNARPHRATVIASSGERTIQIGYVDAAGEFHIDHLPAGDYTLELSGPSTVSPIHVAVTADAATHVRFELPPEPITLAVERAGCKDITLKTAELAWLTYSKCADGVATFEDVTPGAYEVCIEYSTCEPVFVASAPQRQVAQPAFTSE